MTIKPVPDFEGYFADDLGNIYSNRLYSDKRLIKLFVYNSNGYLRVRLRSNDKQKSVDKSVHYLVARAFVEGYKPNLEVNHIDKNRKNNKPSNLEWMTRRDNVVYSIGKKLKVTNILTNETKIYNSITDFSKEIGIPVNNLIKYYIQKGGGFIKRLNLKIEYHLEDIV